MPKIGFRMIKSAIAVFICFIIYMIRGEGMPFYSAIAAILCMKEDISNTVSTAKTRVIATFIGGVAGLLFSVFEHEIMPINSDLIRYLIIASLIIPIIYFSLLIKQPSTAYLSCVVFLCITISHMGDENYIMFACNRMIDTIIGVGVAFLLNHIHFPYKKKTDFIILNIDCLIHDDYMDTHACIQLEKMFQQYPNTTFYSDLEFSSIYQPLKQIPTTLPIILFQGCVLYDKQKTIFENPIYIIQNTVTSVLKLIEYEKVNCFLYEVNSNNIIIHYSNIKNKYEQEYLEKNDRKEQHHFYYHEKLCFHMNHILQIRLFNDRVYLDSIEANMMKYKNEIRVIRKAENELWIQSVNAEFETQSAWIQKQYRLETPYYYENNEYNTNLYFKQLRRKLKNMKNRYV